MQKGLVRKSLVSAVIILFIGVAVAPGINAVDLKVFAINRTTPDLPGLKASEEPLLEITKEDLAELERFFNSILERIGEIRTLADVIAVYNEVITFLDNYGLLPEGISVEELQDLAAGSRPSPELLRLIEEFYLEHLEEIKGENVVSSDGKVVLSCDFYTLNGIERVEKAVAIEDAEHISELMDGSDYDDVASGLSRLGLLPEGMSVGEAEDLISGEYGIRQFERYEEQLKGFPFQPSDTKYNLFSVVSGSGCDYEVFSLGLKIFVYSIYTALFMVIVLLGTIDEFLQNFPWYPVWRVELGPGNVGYLGLFGILAFLVFLFMIFLSDFVFPGIFQLNPIKIGLFLDGRITKANLNTLGLLGKWQMESSTIYLSITGFLGLVIQSWCEFEFSGFCFYIKASDHKGDNSNQYSLPVVSPYSGMQNSQGSQLLQQMVKTTNR